MGFIGNAINDIIGGTTNITLLFLGLLAVAFVSGMFYGIAFINQNTFWWPIYILVIILVLKIVTDVGAKKV